MKPLASDLAKKAVERAVNENISYANEDCKGFVQRCIALLGGSLKTTGTNDIVRNHNAWLGTLSNAKAEGKLIPGVCLLMWREESEKLPAKYHGDGFGDFYHIGIYVGENALTDIYNGKKRYCDVVHSSQSRGKVCGSTLKNAWTHVILLPEVEYGLDIGGLSVGSDAEDILNNEPDATEDVINNEGKMVAPKTHTYIRVTSPNGKPVRIREAPSHDAIYKKGFEANVGERYMVLGEQNGFYKIMFRGKNRWINSSFTEICE